MSARDVALRVRRTDLVRWRAIAERQQAPLDVVIDRALSRLDADPDADAEIARGVRALVEANPPRRRRGRPTDPLVFDARAAAAERHASLEKKR